MSGPQYVTGVYWCTLCSAVHKPIQGSDEYIMKSGWHPQDGNYYNIGFCNGTHKGQVEAKETMNENHA
jgi:hypothetical protein